jgi:hypothetical protein
MTNKRNREAIEQDLENNIDQIDVLKKFVFILFKIIKQT